MGRPTPLLVLAAGFLGASSAGPAPQNAATAAYLDSSGRDDVLSGGVKMITIQTPKGTFRVWTKRVGNNPRIKVLLLHGGPGATHEYFEAFDSYFPTAGIEYYYYDQLGSAYSDQPDDPSCGSCRASWMRWSRSARRSNSTRVISISTANPGAAFSRWSTRSSINRISRL